MTVPRSPCLLDLDMQSPYQCSMYSPATPTNGLGGPVSSWRDYQVQRWLTEILEDHDPADVRLACDRLGALTGTALLTQCKEDLQAQLEDCDLADHIFTELGQRLKAEAQVSSAYSAHPAAPPSLCSPAMSVPSSLGSPTDSCDDTFLPMDEALAVPTGWGTIYHELKPAVRRSSDFHIQEVPSPSWCGSPTTTSSEDSWSGDEVPAAPQRQREHRGGRKKQTSPPARRRDKGGRERPKGRLWQFLVRLLHSESNPALIRWEDEASGVFCFADPQAVARMWGELKQNANMNYEKMSRTMRTYKNKAFVRDTRRLVYAFGPKANWRAYAAEVRQSPSRG